LNRIAYGTFAAATFIIVMAFDAILAMRQSQSNPSAIWCYGSLVPLAICVIVVVCAMELVTLLRNAGQHPHSVFAIIMCVILVASPWLCAGGILGESQVDVEAIQWQVVWIVVAVFGAVFLQFARGAGPSAMADLASTWLVVLYLGLLPSFAVQIRCDYDLANPTEGIGNLLVILLIAFASDVGALYVGRAIGRHKLAPTVSPGKSIEGFVGGVAASVAVALGLWFAAGFVATIANGQSAEIDTLAEWLDRGTSLLTRMSLLQVITLGAVMSIAGQFGDLFESMLKRCAQVKDSSDLIPGLGGILDVIDSAIFACPAAWFLLTRAWGVV